MLLRNLTVHNFKSLRSLSFTPERLTVIVGPNGAGKSNFAEFIHFLSEVYEHGLELAVARKGGYENIAYRRMRRSKGAVGVEVEAEYKGSEGILPRLKLPAQPIRISHSFYFVARESSIRSEFRVLKENLFFSWKFKGRWHELAKVVRKGNTVTVSNEFVRLKGEVAEGEYQRLLEFWSYNFDSLFDRERYKDELQSSELFLVQHGRFAAIFRGFNRRMAGLKVFQIVPRTARDFGVPTPRPELGIHGENLPTVVDFLKRKHSSEWTNILQLMRRLLPGLEEIDVGYSTFRTLDLRFREQHTGRPWNVNEVSDGTIQTLALLVAIFDPRSTALVIEELENSVHPWIIRNLVSAVTAASTGKMIFLTTHSPVVLNCIDPDSIWVMWRAKGSSNIAKVTEIDEKFLKLWRTGKVATFELLDSGAIAEAVPPQPELSLE